MRKIGGPNASRFSDTHWKTLRYFSLYRLCIAILLVASTLFQTPPFSLLSLDRSPYQIATTSIYLLATAASLAVLRLYREHFNWQLTTQVLLDVLVITLLSYTGGGIGSGLGIMLLVTLTGAGLVGQGRLVLFYAAMATLGMLGEQSLRALEDGVGVVDFFQTGLFCAGFFAVAISARLLANRVITNEELARKRGEELRNQTIISQHIIEEMQDGVLVLDREGRVRQHNPRIEQLLGLGDPTDRKLSSYSTELAQSFLNWNHHGSGEPVMVRAPASGMHLRARFVAT